MYFFPIASCCLLCQEINTLKAAGYFVDPVRFSMEYQQQVPMAQPVMVPQQAQMYAAPATTIVYNNY
jgi:hypothetical protein